MARTTFTQSLRQIYPAQPSGADRDLVTSQPSTLLEWTFARTLLGEPIDAAREWLASAAAVLRDPAGDPYGRLLGWVSIAAAQELLDAPASEAVQAAGALVDPALESVLHTRGRVEVASAALAVALHEGNADRVARWRGQQLRHAETGVTSVAPFEMLVLTSGVPPEELDALALANARVALLVMRDSPFQTPQGVILALCALARTAARRPADLYRGLAQRLDDLTYLSGPDHAPDSARTEPETSLVREQGHAVCRITHRFSQACPIVTGAYLLVPLTSGFAGHAREALSGAKKAKTKATRELQGVLALGPGATLPEPEEERLRRRFSVAAEQVSHAIEGSQCRATLRVDRALAT